MNIDMLENACSFSLTVATSPTCLSRTIVGLLLWYCATVVPVERMNYRRIQLLVQIRAANDHEPVYPLRQHKLLRDAALFQDLFA
jgi:hypothetical protein